VLQEAQHQAGGRLAAARHAWELERGELAQQQQARLAEQGRRHSQQLAQLRAGLKGARGAARLQAEELTRLQIERLAREQQHGEQQEEGRGRAVAGGGVAAAAAAGGAVRELMAQAQAVRQRQEAYLRAAAAVGT
jgi:hypothetical protein